jgi:hypothetical protein
MADDQKELDEIIARMEAAGETPESIAEVVRLYDAEKPPSPPTGREILDADKARVKAHADESMTFAKEHPIATGLMIAAPPLLGKLGRVVRPYVPAMVQRVGEFVEQPLVGGLAGAIEGGYRRGGGVEGALYGGMAGAAGGGILGRAMKALGRIMGPKTPPTPTSLEDELRTALEGLRGAPSPNAGGRLATPPPPVTYSPRAQEVLAGVAKAGTPPPPAISQDEMYRALSAKSILSPEEEATRKFLESIVKTRASDVGMSYAAKGGR